MTIGDRYIYESPSFKKVVVEYKGELKVGQYWFQCVECVREPFVQVTGQSWFVGLSRQINLATLRRLWKPYNKSRNFNSLYERLCGESENDID